MAVLSPLSAYVPQWRPVTSIRLVASVRLVAYMWAVGGSSPLHRASGEGQVRAQRLVSYIHGAPEARVCSRCSSQVLVEVRRDSGV